MLMNYHDYGGPDEVLSIVLLLLLDFCLYIVCAFSVLVGDNMACIMVYLMATAVLIAIVYYAGIYFDHVKEAEGAELEK